MVGSNGPTDPTYDLLLELEDLESLQEEMAELGATSTADLGHSASPEATALQAQLEERGLSSLTELRSRINELHRQLDAADHPPR